jgi:rhodanese-related sulfurtransferase/DNA-directed RNA polymerase subunit RPC12/RpoP
MNNFFAALTLLFVVTAGPGFNKLQPINNCGLQLSYRDTQYVCLPCGGECDKAIYTKAGTCPHCNMKLVDKASIKFNEVDPGAVCAFIKDMGQKNVILLDVRSREEFAGKDKDKFGRLKGAINIPVDELERRSGELNKYKNKEIVVYCSHSHRSPRASYILNQKGFTKVTNMEYGMSEWKNRVKEDGCPIKLYVKQ